VVAGVLVKQAEDVDEVKVVAVVKAVPGVLVEVIVEPTPQPQLLLLLLQKTQPLTQPSLMFLPPLLLLLLLPQLLLQLLPPLPLLETLTQSQFLKLLVLLLLLPLLLLLLLLVPATVVLVIEEVVIVVVIAVVILSVVVVVEAAAAVVVAAVVSAVFLVVSVLSFSIIELIPLLIKQQTQSSTTVTVSSPNTSPSITKPSG
jgi:hypothetical protein